MHWRSWGLAFAPEEQVGGLVSMYRDASRGRFGVNFTLISDQRRRIEAALASGARIVSLWYGDPAPYARSIKDAGATLFWTIGSPEEATRARDLGVDFLVVQGSEAGGHLVGTAPIMSLLPAVVDAADGLPVIASGGMADGRGLAAALCLGACGIWMGTRFLASIETANHPGHKLRIVEARFDDLEETTAFDGGWPNAPHRVIRNSTLTRFKGPGPRAGAGEMIGTYPDGRPLLRYDMAAPWAGMEGEWEAAALYAGVSAHLIRSIDPAQTIIKSCSAQAARILTRAGRGHYPTDEE